MKPLEAYRLRRLFAPLLVLTYVLVALQVKPEGEREIYPFFNWSLFSRSTPFYTDATLRITSIDGTPLEQPQLFYDLQDRLSAAKSQDALAFKIVGQFTHAVITGDEARAAELRRVLETRLLNDVVAMEYEIVVIDFDPIRRYETGDIDSIEVVASYVKGAP